MSSAPNKGGQMTGGNKALQIWETRRRMKKHQDNVKCAKATPETTARMVAIPIRIRRAKERYDEKKTAHVSLFASYLVEYVSL